MDGFHIPVLLHDVLDGLSMNPSGIYVDVTFGGGGHSAGMLSRLSDSGKLIAFDQDDDALLRADGDDKRLVLVKSNFRFFSQHLRYLKITEVDGILADLGVSSHQFDTPERGFSIRFDEVLDMRMNRSQKRSALEVLNEYDAEALSLVFRNYGELEKSGKLANAILQFRKKTLLKTTGQLSELVQQVYGQKHLNQMLARVFQAVRIEVNTELDALRDFLETSLSMLKPGGRLAVISYHSLEDRLVKNFMRHGKTEGEQESDVFGNRFSPFNQLTKKPIVPSADEVEQNPRSRSARLRIAEKIK